MKEVQMITNKTKPPMNTKKDINIVSKSFFLKIINLKKHHFIYCHTIFSKEWSLKFYSIKKFKYIYIYT
jgi:hypothetical protein